MYFRRYLLLLLVSSFALVCGADSESDPPYYESLGSEPLVSEPLDSEPLDSDISLWKDEDVRQWLSELSGLSEASRVRVTQQWDDNSVSFGTLPQGTVLLTLFHGKHFCDELFTDESDCAVVRAAVNALLNPPLATTTTTTTTTTAAPQPVATTVNVLETDSDTQVNSDIGTQKQKPNDGIVGCKCQTEMQQLSQRVDDLEKSNQILVTMVSYLSNELSAPTKTVSSKSKNDVATDKSDNPPADVSPKNSSANATQKPIAPIIGTNKNANSHELDDESTEDKQSQTLEKEKEEGENEGEEESEVAEGSTEQESVLSSISQVPNEGEENGNLFELQTSVAPESVSENDPLNVVDSASDTESGVLQPKPSMDSALVDTSGFSAMVRSAPNPKFPFLHSSTVRMTVDLAHLSDNVIGACLHNDNLSEDEMDSADDSPVETSKDQMAYVKLTTSSSASSLTVSNGEEEDGSSVWMLPSFAEISADSRVDIPILSGLFYTLALYCPKLDTGESGNVEDGSSGTQLTAVWKSEEMFVEDVLEGTNSYKVSFAAKLLKCEYVEDLGGSQLPTHFAQVLENMGIKMQRDSEEPMSVSAMVRPTFETNDERKEFKQTFIWLQSMLKSLGDCKDIRLIEGSEHLSSVVQATGAPLNNDLGQEPTSGYIQDTANNANNDDANDNNNAVNEEPNKEQPNKEQPQATKPPKSAFVPAAVVPTVSSSSQSSPGSSGGTSVIVFMLLVASATAAIIYCRQRQAAKDGDAQMSALSTDDDSGNGGTVAIGSKSSKGMRLSSKEVLDQFFEDGRGGTAQKSAIDRGSAIEIVTLDGDSEAGEWLRTVLTSMGYPKFACKSYLRKLKDNFLTTVEQLKELDTSDWGQIGIPSEIVSRVMDELHSAKSKSDDDTDTMFAIGDSDGERGAADDKNEDGTNENTNGSDSDDLFKDF